jgi:hypothetical protein
MSRWLHNVNAVRAWRTASIAGILPPGRDTSTPEGWWSHEACTVIYLDSITTQLEKKKAF